jgi:hypothetical protein
LSRPEGSECYSSGILFGFLGTFRKLDYPINNILGHLTFIFKMSHYRQIMTVDRFNAIRDKLRRRRLEKDGAESEERKSETFGKVAAAELQWMRLESELEKARKQKMSIVDRSRYEIVSKLEVADRHLRVAIRAFFERKDLIAVHTLAAAAQGVLADLARPRGIKEYLR